MFGFVGGSSKIQIRQRDWLHKVVNVLTHRGPNNYDLLCLKFGGENTKLLFNKFNLIDNAWLFSAYQRFYFICI